MALEDSGLLEVELNAPLQTLRRVNSCSALAIGIEMQRPQLFRANGITFFG